MPNKENDCVKKTQRTEKFENLNSIQLIKRSKDGQFGNDDNYYRKRGVRGFNDPRIVLVQDEYITNKNVLDVGCHNGSLTLQIGLRLLPKKIVGMDLDYRLINQATKNWIIFDEKRKLEQADKELHIQKLKALKTIKELPKSFF